MGSWIDQELAGCCFADTRPGNPVPQHGVGSAAPSLFSMSA